MHVDGCGPTTPGEDAGFLTTREGGAVDVVGEAYERLMTPVAAAAAAETSAASQAVQCRVDDHD